MIYYATEDSQTESYGQNKMTFFTLQVQLTRRVIMRRLKLNKKKKLNSPHIKLLYLIIITTRNDYVTIL